MDAARALLAEKGFAGTTVEAIATRAGVGKATIYRRWPTREALLLAVTTADLPEIPTPDTGDLRQDLLLVFTRLAEQIRTAGPASYLGDLIGESTRNPAMRKDFQAIIQQRRSLCADDRRPGPQARRGAQEHRPRPRARPDRGLDLLPQALLRRRGRRRVRRAGRSTPCSTASSCGD